MPAEPPPKSKLLTSLWVTTSRITRFAPDEPEGPPETSTRFPSGVNFRRLPLTGIGKVCVVFLVATSMMVTVPPERSPPRFPCRRVRGRILQRRDQQRRLLLAKFSSGCQPADPT